MAEASNKIQYMARTPFVFNFAGQIAEVPKNMRGICDPQFMSIRQNAEPWRYGTVVVPMTNTAGDLTTPRDATYTIFEAGDDEPGQGFLSLSLAETDALKQGALAKENQGFMITAFAAQIIQPFVQTTSQAPVTGTKNYPTWIEQYLARIKKALYDNLGMKYSYQDEDCRGDLGKVKFWPEHAPLMGGGEVVNGAGMGPGMFTPTRRPLLTGSQNSSDQIAIDLVTGHYNVTVPSDPLLPIPEDVTLLSCPVEVIAIGYPVCRMLCMPACITPEGHIEVSRPDGAGGTFALDVGIGANPAPPRQTQIDYPYSQPTTPAAPPAQHAGGPMPAGYGGTAPAGRMTPQQVMEVMARMSPQDAANFMAYCRANGMV